MVNVRTLLKVGEDFVPIAEHSGGVPDEKYIEGAIELELEGKVLLSRRHWDLVDQLWAYFADGLEEIARGETFSTYFPDSPIQVIFRPDPARGTVTVEVNYRGNTGEASATVGLEEFKATMTREARQSFEALARIAPGRRALYERILRSLEG